MAQFTTSNVSTNLAGRELHIASSFVKQYYTLLNKAPCLIYNFYSHDSTFIHGTIEIANEQYTEPIVGREKIKKKMEDLNLNDCRAKIKQIDCLETLAGGFVIQVVGELSNNGKPMRRFLQTFVLAPSPDEARHVDGDLSQQHVKDGRRTLQVNENNSSSSHNQKFFVLNSIFRYQDDVSHSESESEFKRESSSSKVVSNGTGSLDKKNETSEKSSENGKSAVEHTPLVASVASSSGPVQNVTNQLSATDHLQSVLHSSSGAVPNVRNQQSVAEPSAPGTGSGSGNSSLVPNIASQKSTPTATSNTTTTTNVTPATTNNTTIATAVTSSGSATSTAAATTTTTTSTTTTSSRIPPSNEPKTWANMVRNAHPQPASTQHTTVSKVPSTVDSQQTTSQQQPQQQSQQQQQAFSQQQNVNQSSPVQPNQQQPQSQQTPQPQNANQSSPVLPNQQQNNQNNRNNNRRHVMRKPSNKSAGRMTKSRPPRPTPPAAGKPVA